MAGVTIFPLMRASEITRPSVSPCKMTVLCAVPCLVKPKRTGKYSSNATWRLLKPNAPAQRLGQTPRPYVRWGKEQEGLTWEGRLVVHRTLQLVFLHSHSGQRWVEQILSLPRRTRTMLWGLVFPQTCLWRQKPVCCWSRGRNSCPQLG